MKQLLVLFMLLCSTAIFAQDVIVKKDGSTVVCRVIELTSSEIVYKKWSDLNGSNYIMNRSDASAINYQSGKKVNLSEAGTNLYAPGNQNVGVQKLNDNALIQLDYASNNPYKKVKTLKTIGWIGGCTMIAGGIIWYALSQGGDSRTTQRTLGLSTCGVGAIWTASFLLSATLTKKNIDKRIQGTAIYYHHFRLSDKSNLYAGVDMINDYSSKEKALGLGLRYNF